MPIIEGDSDHDTKNGEIPILEAQNFERNVDKPVPEEEDIKKYDGIMISNFPLHLADTDILSFLFEKGLPQDIEKNKVQLVRSDRNVKVSINDSLEYGIVQTLIKNIHYHESLQKFWNLPLYCKPMRALTPEKPASDPLSTEDVTEEEELVVNNFEDAVANEFVAETSPRSDPDNLCVKPKLKQLNLRPMIPGMPEIDRKKAEQASKRKKQREARKHLRRNSLDDFDFGDFSDSDATKTLSFSDIQSVFDKGKRKPVSPAESEKFKKPK